jgi:hypothetical protein
LDPVEKAIRTALEKGEADERAFREGVYRKAFAALERALESNPVAPELAQRRRSSVQAKIAEIESEYIPAFPSLDAIDREPAPEPEPSPAPAEPPFARPGDVYASTPPEPAPPPRYAAAEPAPAVYAERPAMRVPPIQPRPESAPARPEQIWRTGDRVEPSFDASGRQPELAGRPEPLTHAELPLHAEAAGRAEPQIWSEPEPSPDAPQAAPTPAWNEIAAPRQEWPEATPETGQWAEPAPAAEAWTEPVPPAEQWAEAAAPAGQWAEPAEPTVEEWQAAPAPEFPAAEPEIRVAPPVTSAGRAAAPSVAPAVETDTGGAVPRNFFPDLDDFGQPGTRPTAAPGEEPEGPTVSTDGGPNVARERRRPFAAMFIVATLLAAVGIGVWWGINTGLFKSAEEIAGDEVPNPPTVAEGEDFIPEDENNAPQLPGEADAERNWISVFTPDDPTIVSAPGDTTAEVMEDDTGEFLRIRSGASGSAISFDVGQGILEQLAGKHAVFDISARSEEGKETQFAVDCNFGELGDCGRKRYAAGYAKGDFLFEMELPAKSPGASGTIAITPDIAGQGKALDIFEIRVSASSR